MKNSLVEFLNFEATKQDLINVYGEDLYNVDIEPVIVSATSVISAIEKFQAKIIDKSVLLDWVNVVWFTDLFEYSECETDSIASVLTVLETLDEDNISITEKELNDMKVSLANNTEFVYT